MPSKKSAPSGASPEKSRRSAGSVQASSKPRAAAATKREPAKAVSIAQSEPAVRAASVERDPKSVDLRWLTSLFKPTELEQRLLTALSQRSETNTVESLATQLGVASWQLGALLAPGGLLRASALVETGSDAELGPAHPDERIQLGRGLWIAAHDREQLPTQIPGLSVLPTSDPDEAWAAAFVADRPSQVVLELVKDRLVSVRPLLLLLSGCSAETTALLTQALRLRLSRPVFFVEASALAGWPQPELSAALRRLRRDADIKGAAVVVQDVEQLGAAWRALTHPKPAGQTAPVILCSSGSIATPRHGAGGTHGSLLQLMTHSLRTTPSQAATTVANGTAAATVEADPPDVDRSREEARRQAALDAARAMGKPIPKEFMAPEPAPTPAVKAPAPVPTVAATAPAKPIATPAPAPAAMKAEPAPAPAKAVETATAPARPVNPRLAAALAKAGLPPAGSAAYQTERAAPEKTATPAPQEVAPAAVAAPAEKPEPATTAIPVSDAQPVLPSPAAQTQTAEAATDDQADGAPLPLSDDAKLDELISVAKNTASNLQRAQVLRKLAGAKSPLVIQLFRMFLNHPNAAVRSAAEAGMESIFGSNWNRARAIAPPIQPPRSEDGGRGPGGAF